MHALIIFMMGVMVLSAIITIISLVVDENLTPVGKTFASLFVGTCALVLALQTVLDFSRLPYRAVGVGMSEYSQHFIDHPVVESDPVAVPAQVVESPRTIVAAPGAIAPAVVMVQPQQNDTAKDMLLGGALGYLAGSAGRGGSETHTVTNHTTIIHAAPPAPVAAAAPPRVTPAAPRATFRSSFSMSRGR